MGGCCIRNCKNRPIKGGPFRFFSFPTNEAMANEWLRLCKPKTTVKHGRVCSSHFVPTDFARSLRHILMNESPVKVRTLKPEAVPTQHLDNIDAQTTNIDNAKILTEDSNSCNNKTIVIEVPGPSNDSERIPNEITTSNNTIHIIQDKDNNNKQDIMLNNAKALTENPSSTNNKTILIEVPHSSDSGRIPNENANSKNTKRIQNKFAVPLVNPKTIFIKILKPSDIARVNANAIPVVESSVPIKVESSSKEDRGSKKHVTFDIPDAEEHSESQSHEEHTESVKDCKEGQSQVIIPLSEYKLLKKKANEYTNLRNSLEQIFTPGQIKYLLKPNDRRRRVRWTPEDISAAISLKKNNPKSYHHLRDSVGIPLPGYSTLQKWVSKYHRAEGEVPPNKNITEEQIEVLISAMEDHRDLATGRKLRSKRAKNRVRHEQLWEEIAARLNALEGLQKTAIKWREYWFEKKATVRRKLIKLHTKVKMGAAGHKRLPTLTNHDLRILNFMKMRTFTARGAPSVQLASSGEVLVTADSSAMGADHCYAVPGNSEHQVTTMVANQESDAPQVFYVLSGPPAFDDASETLNE